MSDEIDLSTEEEVVEPVVEETSEPKSMDDTIRETLDKINAREEGDRARDERGRFARTEKPVETPVETPTEATETPVEAIETPAPTVPPELQRLGLRKEEAEVIAKDPAVMQAFIRRSEEMHKGLEQYRQKAQVGDNFERTIQPYMQNLAAAGVDPVAAAGHLFASEHALRHGTPQQRLQMIHKIASDYGIDLNQAQEYSANQPYVDPQVSQLQSELQRMQGWIEQQNQAREWQEREALNSAIEAFKSDPAHTYFESVRNDMAGLLQAGLATDLKDAYEKAIYANPTVRAQVLAAQQNEAAEKAKREAQQKAQAAKQAAAVNLTRRGVAPPARPIGSMEDTIRETAQRLGIM